jgi:hypothetical protein
MTHGHLKSHPNFHHLDGRDRSGIDIEREAERDRLVWRVSDRLAEAAGACPAEKARSQEIGNRPLTPAAVEAVKKDLKANPPQPFDVARALRVFTSRLQYVEIKIENYRLSTRRVELPHELLDITDDRLRKQISGRLRPLTKVSGPFRIKVETSKGEKSVKIDETWLAKERKRIEEYTFVVPNFGRVILRTDRSEFDAEIERFKRNLEKYYQAVIDELEKVKSDLEKRLVKEYLPRWRKRPPSSFVQYGVEASSENLKRELLSVVQQVTREAVSFEKPRVRVVYKNVAPESVGDSKFLEPLKQKMRRRNVPVAVIESLFNSGDAAPASGGLAQALLL